MANVIPTSFKSELLSGTHNFASGGNSFKIALYTDISGLTASTTAFTTTNQVSSSGTSYTSGGQALDSQAVSTCLLYTSPSPRDLSTSRMPSSA